jgi:aminopeptidase N
LAVAAAALVLASCQAQQAPSSAHEAGEVAPILDAPDAVDIHSYARPLEARVTHVALDLAVDFAAKRVGGTATLDIQARPDAREIILDDKGLEIEAVADGSGKALRWKVGAGDQDLGAPLSIAIGPDTKKVVVRYKSAAVADALQWLTPEQTAGKKYPFLFSQGERSSTAAGSRPRIPNPPKLEAKISVDKPTVVMSAPRAGDPADSGNRRIFSFRMDHPVAPYLIAIAAGDLAFKDLGPRTGVWAEPATLDRAAAELSDTEKMVSAAEALYGPYQWGRYDMLVLPPSFPFGGMENPTLTFPHADLHRRRQSLTSLIAHELAHSWSGNLATNATWADFWLNEGIPPMPSGGSSHPFTVQRSLPSRFHSASTR